MRKLKNFSGIIIGLIGLILCFFPYENIMSIETKYGISIIFILAILIGAVCILISLVLTPWQIIKQLNNEYSQLNKKRNNITVSNADITDDNVIGQIKHTIPKTVTTKSFYILSSIVLFVLSIIVFSIFYINHANFVVAIIVIYIINVMASIALSSNIKMTKGNTFILRERFIRLLIISTIIILLLIILFIVEGSPIDSMGI